MGVSEEDWQGGQTRIPMVTELASGWVEEDNMGEGEGQLDGGEESGEEERSVTEQDGLDWKILRAEFNLRNLWSGRTKSAVAKHAIMVLVFSLLPSIFDIGTDIGSGKNYIEGQMYTVDNYMDDTTNSTKEVTNIALGEELADKNNFTTSNPSRNCSLKGIYTSYTEEPSYERLDCFAKDEVMGYFTVGVIFLPGILGGRRVWAGLLSWIMSLVIAPFFPLVIIAVKTISLLNPGKHWMILSIRVTAAEGTWESTFQILLQLYVILSSTRIPATIQLLSITTSLIVVIKAGIEDYMLDRPPMDGFEDTVKKMGVLFPLFLTNIVFKLGCWAVLATLLKFWVALIPIAVIIIALLTGACTKNKYLFKHFGGHAVTLRKGRMADEEKNLIHFIFGNTLWSFLSSCCVSVLVIVANVAPDTVVSGLPVLGWPDQQLGDIHIVSNIHLLNTIYIVVMSCGIFSAVLVYLQVVRSLFLVRSSKRV